MIITAGIYKGRKLAVPDKNKTRPTLSQVRMGVFNTLYSIMGEFEGKTFLDLFGGSGVMGLEALSRGFSRVKVFEKNPKAAQIIRKNYEQLGLKADLAQGDSVKLIEKFDEHFDVVYIDPPYLSGIYEAILPKVNGEIIIAEHSEKMLFEGFTLLKEKYYGGKLISYLQTPTK